MLQTHTFDPVFDENSRMLVLGTLPSVKSRENGFYYGHPRNRFWRVIAAVLSRPVPESIEEKRGLLLEGGIALWDVIRQCDITASADSSIRDAVPNDIGLILSHCRIENIFANGQTAARLYDRLLRPSCGRGIITLPSTSPANAAWSEARLIDAWRRILE